ncbi:class I SAM-dependent methyltransferase [Cellulomonas soli]|nr:class I SAM-dependent methyltransferase [Cellulomonas soli]NYI59066.1 methyltransferase (TIGR00027 family) [Cellulomonas soli]
MSAAARAAHRLVDDAPLLLDDPMSEQLLGEAGTEAIGYHRLLPHEPVLAAARVSACVRQHLVEAVLAEEAPDVLVLLGAGLDTSGVRHASTGATVVELDLPTTQRWKRDALARAGVEVPPSLRWIPADLRTDDPVALLRTAGVGPEHRTLVSWLGVSMYLTARDVSRTLARLAALGPGTALVMDSLLDPGSRDDAGRRYAETVSAMAGSTGEPWLWTTSTEDLGTLLRGAGWRRATLLTEREAAGAGAWARTDTLVPGTLSTLTVATVA